MFPVQLSVMLWLSDSQRLTQTAWIALIGPHKIGGKNQPINDAHSTKVGKENEIENETDIETDIETY